MIYFILIFIAVIFLTIITISKNKSIKELEAIINLQKEMNDNLNSKIKNLKLKVDELSKELSFYTGIKEDSLNLNVDDVPVDFLVDKTDFLESQTETSVNDLNPEKKELFNLMENTSFNLFITGKAGTGKSYLLKYFKSKTNKRVLYTAPTGVAALNIDGVTIHSAFGFSNLVESNEIHLSENQKELFKKMDTIIIDEVSMVRVDIFNKIDKILQLANNNFQPFGGKQIILFGDLFQLPPVANKEETAYLTDKYGGIYFFNHPGYDLGNFIFKELTQVFRQSDERFISLLNNLREGNIISEDIELLNEHYTNEIPRRVIQVVPTKNQASVVNTKNIENIPGKEYIYSANILKGENKYKETDFPCDFQLTLKVGAMVMMIVNDPEHQRWVNGTIGIISGLTTSMIKVTINGTDYEINRHIFNKLKCVYNRQKGTIEYVIETSVSQFPIILAYAITIHKSQGMTYQQIAVNIENCFAAGQAYVALSRCADFNRLFLIKKVNPNCIITDNAVVNFYNLIREEIGVT